MTLYLLIFASLIVLLVVFDLVVQRTYQNKPSPHETDPRAVGIPFESVRFPAEDGGSLHGWWINGSSDAQVLILVHGWENNAGRLMSYIEHLHPLGYNLLAIDTRNHGDSSPLARPTVWSFTRDTLAAMRYVQEQYEGKELRIGLVGFSIGGGATINAAALNPAISTVLTVGAISHPLEVMRLSFDHKGIPYFPFIWMFFKYLQYRFRIPFHRIAPVRHISRVKVPVLLIHGENDDIVPPEQGRKLLAAADPDRTSLHIVPGMGHGDWEDRPGFWKTVEGFLKSTMEETEPREPDHGEAGLGSDR